VLHLARLFARQSHERRGKGQGGVVLLLAHFDTKNDRAASAPARAPAR
jgi:hypothetical protein